MGLELRKGGVTHYMCLWYFDEKIRAAIHPISYSMLQMSHTFAPALATNLLGGYQPLKPVSERTHILCESKVGTFPPQGRSTVLVLPEPHGMTVSRAKSDRGGGGDRRCHPYTSRAEH